MKTIIKDGTIITENETRIADLLIEEGKVSLIESNLHDPEAHVFDAKGKLVLPGGVDAHVHLDLPMFNTVSSDDHYTGGKAAAFGGTTTMIDFVSQGEGTLHESIEKLKNKAEFKVCIDYSFHMNITRFDENVAVQIKHLPEDGITSLKVFTAYNKRLRLEDEYIYKVMEIARDSGILTLLHAENGDEIEQLTSNALSQGHFEPYWHARTRPSSGAIAAGQRIIEISAKTGAPLYIVHMNAGGEVDNLTAARKRGLKVMGETCPQYLFFTEDELRRPDGAKWVCSPPIRTKEDNKRLLKGISHGEIQVIATDHCPFFFDGSKSIIYEGKPIAIPGKELGSENFTKIPNGLPALGDRMPILWTYAVGEGLINPNQFVKLMCTNPARIFGLYPQKGTLTPGSDADVVIWDPEKLVDYGVKIAQHRTDYNLFENWKLKGFPETVFLRGHLILDKGNWFGRQGQGKYLYCVQGEIL